jgi:hypothetical protein
MNSNLNSQLSTFTSSENKGLLWSVLHGGGRFNGVPDASLKKVQVMFETTLNEMNESFQKTNQFIDLNIMNKEAVYAICKKLDNLMAEENKKSTIDQKKQQQIPQLETVYRAEDIQKERQSAFNMELKKKEEEMSSIIKLRKPDEIKFLDDVYDKPIGNDMERLLAETLASRERELEQLNNSTGKEDKIVAEKWINPNLNKHSTSANSNYINDSLEKKKKVSFNVETEPEDEPVSSSTTITEPESTETALELNAIMNKFKKINTNKNSIQNSQSVNNNNNNNSLIIQMSEDITFIKNMLIELSEKIKTMSS